MARTLPEEAGQMPIRMAAASPKLKLLDIAANENTIVEAIGRANALYADFLVLPELCLVGATAGSLLKHPFILSEVSAALARIAERTKDSRVTVSVGLPYAINGTVRSCTALLRGSRVCAILPSRSDAPPFGFLPALDYTSETAPMLSPIPRLDVVFAGRMFNKHPSLRTGYAVLMPSAFNATACSDRTVQNALMEYSARTGAAVAYAAPGMGESGSTDVFDGICAIAANGEILAESDPFEEDPLIYADVETFSLRAFEPYVAADTDSGTYLSGDPDILAHQCRRILELQAHALKRRIEHISGKGFVIGVSGGLDSALALLASVRAAEIMGRENVRVLGVSMPGFGSSSRTRNNAKALCEALRCEYREISVVQSTRQHFLDIGHDEKEHDVVFENAQARERTKILLSIANGEGLLDIGTGDLSEAALGWTTFGGDHLAQYGINASLPKTVIREVVREAASRFPAAEDILLDILDTPVSPELLPGKDGEIAQKTEDIVGSYELHDFFLYHMLKGKGPAELYDMAVCQLPFEEAYVYKVLGIFLTRFFGAQYKRVSAPECPNLLFSIGPSSFNMPADMHPGAFLSAYERMKRR